MEWDSESNSSSVNGPIEGVSLVSVEELTASFSKMHRVCQTPTFERSAQFEIYF